jgi:hypothetical protein
MKRKLTYSILSLIIILSCSVIGCSPSTQQSEPANTWAISLLDMVPNGSSVCRITNISTIHADPDLSSTMDLKYIYYDTFDELQINLQNVNYTIETDGLIVFIGNCSLENLTNRMNENGTNHRTILGVEAWDFESKHAITANGTPFIWIIAIHNEQLFVGTSETAIKDWLTFTTNASPSINSNPDFNDLFSRLPNGFFITYSTNPPDDFESQGFESLAGVMSKKNHEYYSATGIYKYQNEDTAKAAYPIITAQVENDDESQNVQVTREGNYIIFTGDFPISPSTGN